MVFCNVFMMNKREFMERHNPYFNRWFSAIKLTFGQMVKKKRHNPYFNRWFSAMREVKKELYRPTSHNPYFNRWFSAINKRINYNKVSIKVTILILIDGFLQSVICLILILNQMSHNPYFNRWFSAI